MLRVSGTEPPAGETPVECRGTRMRSAPGSETKRSGGVSTSASPSRPTATGALARTSNSSDDHWRTAPKRRSGMIATARRKLKVPAIRRTRLCSGLHQTAACGDKPVLHYVLRRGRALARMVERVRCTRGAECALDAHPCTARRPCATARANEGTREASSSGQREWAAAAHSVREISAVPGRRSRVRNSRVRTSRVHGRPAFGGSWLGVVRRSASADGV